MYLTHTTVSNAQVSQSTQRLKIDSSDNETDLCIKFESRMCSRNLSTAATFAGTVGGLLL